MTGDEPTDGEAGDCLHHPPAERTWSAEEERALRLWIVLARAYTTFARSVSAKVTEYGLTPAQFGILEALHHLGPLSLGELADKLLVTGGNVTYVMDRLEASDLVRRRRSGQDRRVIVAHLTERGRCLIGDVFPGHAAFVRAMVDPLERGEQEELRRLLKKLGRGIATEDPGEG